MEEYAALLRVTKKEATMNARLFQTRVGHPVLFGEAVQLRHVTSGKFLSVCREETSEQEPENFKVLLEEIETEKAWFKLAPAAPINSDGDQIGNLSDVILSPLVYGDEAVHVASRPLSQAQIVHHTVQDGEAQQIMVPSEVREVNSCFDSSILRVVLFSESHDSACLHCGDLVYVHDPEGKYCLRPMSEEESEASPATVVLFEVPSTVHKDSGQSGVFFAPMVGDDEQSAAIWVVEKINKQLGGPLEWNAPYTLRHLLTGQFLQWGGSSLGLSMVAMDHTTSISFSPASASALRAMGDERWMHDTCASLLRCDHNFATIGNEYTVNGETFSEASVASDRRHSALVLRRIVSEGHQHPVMVGLQAKPPLVKLSQAVQLGVPPTLERDSTQIISILEQLCNFVVDDDISGISDKLSHNIRPMAKRQTMLHEQGILDIVLDILEYQQRLLLNDKHAGAQQCRDDSAWSTITMKSLIFLRLVCIRNERTSLRAGDRMAVLMQFVGQTCNKYALLVLAELLSDMEVQTHKVSKREVDVVLNKLKEKSLNSTALRVLAQLCECGERGVPSNQQLLYDLLLVPEQDDNQLDAQCLVVITPNKENNQLELKFPQSIQALTVYNLTAEQSGYLADQLYVLAALCSHRFYVAIAHLQQVLPFEHLNTHIQDNSINIDIRTAFVRLIITLYVDREPQIDAIGTGMSFLWSKIVKPNHVILPVPVAPDNVARFAPLQKVISQELEFVQMNDFTTNCLNLFSKLLDFNFYNSDHQILQDAVNDLIGAISVEIDDRRSVRAANKLAAALADDVASVVLDRSAAKCGDIVMRWCRKVKQRLDETILDRKVVIRFLDSIPMMIFMLSLVAAAITVMLVQEPTVPLDAELLKNGTASGSTANPIYHPGYDIFEKVTFTIFACELSTRMIAVGSLKKFFTEPFSCIDFTVVFLDVLMMAGANSLGGQTKALRAIRMLRLGRAFRMVKLAIKIREEMRRSKTVVPWVLSEKFTQCPKEKLEGMTSMMAVLILVENMLTKHRFEKLLASLKALHHQTLLREGRALKMIAPASKLAAVSGAGKAVVGTVGKGVTKAGSVVASKGVTKAILRCEELKRRPSKVTPRSCEEDEQDVVLCTMLEGGGVNPAMPFAEILDCISEPHEVTLECEDDFDLTQMLFKMIMFEWTPLAHNAIEVLMRQYESSSVMVENMKKFQLLSHVEDQELYLQLDKEINELLRLVEVYELWQHMKSHEDISNGLRVAEILAHLRTVMLEPDPLWLGGGSQYRPRQTVQIMLRNLGAFELAVIIRAKIPVSEFVPSQDLVTNDPEALARGIRRLNSDFLSWFVHKNNDNQTTAFMHLSGFIDDLDCSVGSSSVIVETLRDNEELVKLVPSTLFDAVLQRLKLEPDPALIEIFRIVILCNGVTLRENQLHLFQLLSSPAVIPYLFLCNDPDSAEFEERREMMEVSNARLLVGKKYCHPAMAVQFVRALQCDGETPMGSTDKPPGYAELCACPPGGIGVRSEHFHMPLKLQFHVQVLELLSDCAAGRINIVEARVQALFPANVLLVVINDPLLLPDIRLPLVRLMYEAVIDVQVAHPETNTNSLFWDMLDSFPVALTQAQRALENATQSQSLGRILSHQSSDEGRKYRSQIRFVFQQVVPILKCYLDNQFDPVEVVRNGVRTQPHLDNFFGTVHRSLLDVYKSSTPGSKCDCVSIEQHDALYKTLTFVAGLATPSANVLSSAGIRHVADLLAPESRVQRREPDAVSAHFVKSLHQFAGNSETTRMTADGMRQCSSKIKKLPRLDDNVTEDIRYEPLVKKMVRHAEGLLGVAHDRKTLPREFNATTLWLLRLFRTMVEEEWHFNIDDRDDMGDDQSDALAWPYQSSLTSCGVAQMCVSLIAPGIDRVILLEAVRVLVTLLYVEGGCVFVQNNITEKLGNGESELFFIKLADGLQEIISWADVCKANKSNTVNAPPVGQLRNSGQGSRSGSQRSADQPMRLRSTIDDEIETPEVVTLKLMQLMCEGHHLPNQELLKEQPANDQSINILELLVRIIYVYKDIQSRSSTAVITMVCVVILDAVQGPCVKNQFYLALETELMEYLNALLRFEPVSDQVLEEETRLKIVILKTFKALTECQDKPSLVFERLMSAVHSESLTRHLKVPAPAIPLESIKDEIERAEAVDRQMQLQDAPLTAMQVECIVLIQMMCDYNPDFPDEVSLPQSVRDKLGVEVVSVEIVWNGDLQRRFFHVPDMCKNLSSATRSALVEQINYDSQDQKLQEFMTRCKIIMCELEHQELLRLLGVSEVFNRSNQNTMTWVSFVINLLINLVSICFLSWGHQRGDDNEIIEGMSYADPQLPPDWIQVQLWLNIVQITCASFTLILYLIVMSPVIYKNGVAQGGTVFWSVLTVLNPFKGLENSMTPYYMFYVVCAVLGMTYPILNAFLLFDILIKNSTSRDVLQAVAKPIKQLAATMFLLFVIIYIFAFLLFQFYQADFLHDECDTLGRCFLVSITVGLRNGGGMGDYLYSDQTQDGLNKAVSLSDDGVGQGRFWIDVFFFMIIIIILLNIIFGIIIDNFAELRDEKKQRKLLTEDFCFICGLDRTKFDKLSSKAYHTHVKTDHHMWNYLYFMVSIWNQDKDDDDGVELYVRKQIGGGDIDWFPEGVCLMCEDELDLENKHIKEQALFRQTVLGQLEKHHVETDRKIDALQAALTQFLVKESSEGSDNGRRSSTVGWSSPVPLSPIAESGTPVTLLSANV
jgi:hypothetical protein